MSYQPPAAPPPPGQPYQPQGAPQGPVPLRAPLYGASFGDAVRRFFKKYADFTGRASRSEYWWWILLQFLIGLALWLLAFILGVAGPITSSDDSRLASPGFWVIVVIATVWGLATLVPHLAVTWRRLHDANLAGPWWFLSFVPFGSIVILVFTLLQSNPQGARFDRPTP